MRIHPTFFLRALRTMGAVLLLAAGFSSQAHDPYEISATACLFSNRVDVDVAMEFRTGMRLAGLAPRPPDGISNTNWFLQNQGGLMACAQSFCQLQAGGSGLPVQAGTLALGEEEHLKVHLKYPPANGQSLRFDVSGLKALAGQGHYGLTLTVLDMVHGAVLGQSVLFADAPCLVAEVAAPGLTAPASVAATIPAAIPDIASRTNAPLALEEPSRASGSGLVLVILAGALLVLAGYRTLLRNPRKR